MEVTAKCIENMNKLQNQAIKRFLSGLIDIFLNITFGGDFWIISKTIKR